VKEILYVLGMILFVVLFYAISSWIFNVVINSDLSLFWKWIILH